MHFRKVNDEVLYTSEDITVVNARDIQFLKDAASHTQRKRIRLCAHRDQGNPLHEMLIVLARGSYIRPHIHKEKTESFHIVEGKLRVVVFTDDGELAGFINMGPLSSGEVFYYRLSNSSFHTVIPISDFVVFHETTNGPFRSEDTIFPAWAPPEGDREKIEVYLAEVCKGLEDGACQKLG